MADIGNDVNELSEFGPGNQIILWKLVIESDFGQESILNQDLTELFQKDDFMSVSVLTGITKYEFLHPAIS